MASDGPSFHGHPSPYGGLAHGLNEVHSANRSALKGVPAPCGESPRRCRADLRGSDIAVARREAALSLASVVMGPPCCHPVPCSWQARCLRSVERGLIRACRCGLSIKCWSCCDDALSRLEGKDHSPTAAVRLLKKGLRSALYQRLAQAGVLKEETRRLLGLFPTAVWPTADATRETELSRTLERVRFQGTAPEPRLDALIGCLSVVGMAHKVLPATDPKAVRRAAREARGRNWGARVARAAYDAAVAASAAGS